MYPNNPTTRKKKIQERLDISGFIALGLGVLSMLTSLFFMNDITAFGWCWGAFTIFSGWFVVRAVGVFFLEDPVLNGTNDK